MKTADERLADIRMQLRLKQREMRILAGENPFLEYMAFQQVLQRRGHVLEVLADLVFNPALGVTAVIAGITVTAAPARQWVEQVFALGQLAEAKVKDAGPVPVNQHDAQ